MHIRPLLLSVCEGCPVLSTYQLLFKQKIELTKDNLFAFNIFPVTAVFRLSSGLLLKVLFSCIGGVQDIYIP